MRKRPGMYIGSTGPTGLHHLVWEVVDNSVDEAMAGRCHPDRRDPPGRRRRAGERRRARDPGRHPPQVPQDSRPPRSSCTTLHAGGKFGGKGYKVSGGLHGVGISVVNALSTRLVLEVDRDGQHWEAEFEKGGKLKEKFADMGRRRRTAAPVSRDRHDGDLLARRRHLRRDRVPGPDDRSSGCRSWPS